jgi:hypothetical protein
MSHSRLARSVFIVALLVLPVVNSAAQESTPEPTSARWLFTIGFNAATIQTRGDAGATLILTGLHPYVVAFTDAPQRQTAVLPLEDAITFVNTGWVEPPNADVVAQSVDAGTDYQIVVELVAVEHDPGGMTIDVSGVSAFVGGEEQPFAEILPIQLGPGYVFVDDLEAHGAQVGSPGVLSGNVVQMPLVDPGYEPDDRSTPAS